MLSERTSLRIHQGPKTHEENTAAAEIQSSSQVDDI